MNFKPGTRVRVRISDTVICEYWNVPATVTENSAGEDDGFEKYIEVIFDYDPFEDGFYGPHYFTEEELKVINT